MPNPYYPQGFYGYPYLPNSLPPVNAYPQYPFMNPYAQMQPYAQVPTIYPSYAPYENAYPYAQMPGMQSPYNMPVVPAYSSTFMPIAGYGFANAPYTPYQQDYMAMAPYQSQMPIQSPDPAQAAQAIPQMSPEAFAPYGQANQPAYAQYPGAYPEYDMAGNSTGNATMPAGTPAPEDPKATKEQKKRHAAHLKMQEQRRQQEEKRRKEAAKKAKSQRENRERQQAKKHGSGSVASAQSGLRAENAAAAAAASIAAFHEAAKSVNEINMNGMDAAASHASEAIATGPETTNRPYASTSSDTIPLTEEQMFSAFGFTDKGSGNAGGKNSDKDDVALVEEAKETSNGPESSATSLDAVSFKSEKGKAAMEEISERVSKEASPASSNAKAAASGLSAPKGEPIPIKGAGSAGTAGAAGAAGAATMASIAAEAASDAGKTEPKDAKGENASTKASTQKASTDKSEKTGDGTGATEAFQPVEAKKPTLTPLSVLGVIISLVGIGLAIGAVWVNYLGYGALACGAIGLILSIIGIYVTRNGRHTGKAMGICGAIFGVAAIACAIVLHLMAPVQSIYMTTDFFEEGSSSGISIAGSSSYSTATDPSAGAAAQSSSAANDTGATTPNGSASSSASSSSSLSTDVVPTSPNQNLSVGQAVSYSNGLNVCLAKVDNGIGDYNGKSIIAVSITYTNEGPNAIKYNAYDWKATDGSGSTKTYTIYPNGVNELNNGELAPGQTVTGNLYFTGPVKSITYEASYFNAASNATWNI